MREPLSGYQNIASDTIEYDMLTILLAQTNPIVGDIAGNAKCMIDTLKQNLGADLIVFPELALTGYPPEDLLLRDDFHQAIEEQLRRIATHVHDQMLLVGYPRRVAGQIFNSAVLIHNGQLQASYDKQDLPNYGVFDERRYFTAGNKPYVFTLKGTKIGVLICEDIWQEYAYQASVEAGAELCVVMNASPFEMSKFQQRADALNARQQQSPRPILYCNLVGGQDELVFDGGSFAMDAHGELVAIAKFFEPDNLAIQYDQQQDVLLGDAVQPTDDTLALVYQALVRATRDYVEKNGFPGVILGLSGGIDSALTLAIAVDALGTDKVRVVMMPSRYTADISQSDAAEQASLLGVEYSSLAIEQPFEAFLQLLADDFAGLPVDATEENIQARCRGILLMALSNKTGRLVLTTGNKSEMAVGYATLYGDMAGGFAVLKDVPKTLVYQLADYRNTVSPAIPQRVIDRPPSAELAPDQKDSDSLPDYDVLDEIVERYVERDQGMEKIIAAGFSKTDVKRVITLIKRNEYKRRQAPPGPKVTARAFGRERRYPITAS